LLAVSPLAELRDHGIAARRSIAFQQSNRNQRPVHPRKSIMQVSRNITRRYRGHFTVKSVSGQVSLTASVQGSCKLHLPANC
jgi:hypothetical protein